MDLSRLFRCEINENIKIKYVHSRKECDRNAFDISESLRVVLYIPRSIGVTDVSASCFSDKHQSVISTSAAEWVGFDGILDKYIIALNARAMGVGLYFLSYTLMTANGKLYIFRSGNTNCVSDKPCNAQGYQLTISDFLYKEPKRYYGGIIYHIFVDRFYYSQREELKSGAVYFDSWDVIPEYPAYPGAPLKNNIFYGGNLYGIIEKLPYIASLGTTLIYLSPIFDSPSNHKYDTADYLTVDSMFGGDDALKELIKAASGYGISIILDGVFNHTGDDSKYFNRYGRYSEIGAYQSVDSPYYQWYSFEKYPDKYTSWWGIKILPRINPDLPECRRFFLDEGGVVDKYSKLGVAGFRLDVVDELSDDFVKGIKKTLNSGNSDSILYGEVWEDASNKIAYGKRKSYYLGDELDGVMNYPVRRGIIEFLTDHDSTSLEYALRDVYNNAPSRIANLQMNLLGSHDTVRIITALGTDDVSTLDNHVLATKRLTKKQRELAISRLKMAYCILSTIPGIPSIFYGDEVGLEGYSDPFNRMPYPWGSEDLSILDFYRELGEIRRSEDVYLDGELNIIQIDKELLIFSRKIDQLSIITVINNSTQDLVFEGDSRLTPLLGDRSSRVVSNGCQLFKTKSKNIYYLKI